MRVSGQASLISMVFSCLCSCHSSQKSIFFLYQKDKCSESKVKFRQASYGAKGSITSQKLGSRDVWQIANSVLSKGKSAILPLFSGPEVLPSASDKAKLFAENFSKNSNLDDSGISLPVFPF